MTPAGSEARLRKLADRARAELAMPSFATKPWVMGRERDGARQYDVVVVGAGQSGLAVGHALLRSGIRNLLLLDRNAEGIVAS